MYILANSLSEDNPTMCPLLVKNMPGTDGVNESRKDQQLHMEHTYRGWLGRVAYSIDNQKDNLYPS